MVCISGIHVNIESLSAASVQTPQEHNGMQLSRAWTGLNKNKMFKVWSLFFKKKKEAF
jgi:hypothetical protein